MKDRIKESMSSLCDGECSELELRRVLNYVGSDSEMREEWRRYNLIGALIRDEPAGSVDLSSRIMKALDDERFGLDDHEAEAFNAPASPVSSDDSPAVQSETVQAPASRGLPQWMVSGAVAASVTLAILAGARIINEQSVLDGAATVASNAPVSTVTAPEFDDSFGATSTVAMTHSSEMSAEELKQAQQVLQQYVLEHEEQAAGVSESDPFARVANFGQSSSSAKTK